MIAVDGASEWSASWAIAAVFETEQERLRETASAQGLRNWSARSQGKQALSETYLADATQSGKLVNRNYGINGQPSATRS
jgi:hypothetical protein